MGNSKEIMPQDKMCIRNKVVSLLLKYQKTSNVESSQIKKDIQILKDIENNNYVVRILLDEIDEKNREYSNICAVFLMQIATQLELEKEALRLLNSKRISDNKKFFIISILKQRGVGIALDNMDKYIHSDESLFDEQINDFLDNAYNNAEVQIDLLDFFCNIIPLERLCLLENLKNELTNDKLAMIFSLIAHCELEKSELDIILDTLLSINSLYSTYGLEYIHIKNSKETFLDNETVKKIELKIKKNKLKDKDFVDLSLIKDSIIDKCLISLVDGKSTFSLFLSRVNKDNSRNCILLTIDITKGITSIIGFSNLELSEFLRIVKRVYNNCLISEINPIAFKAIFEFYYNKNIRTNTLLPYECAVWKKYLNDIRDIDYDLSEFLNLKLDITDLTHSKVKKMIKSKFFENWFYLYNENENIDRIIDFIEQQEKLDLYEIEQYIKEILIKEFIENKEYIQKIHSDLLIQAYVSHLSRFKATSNAMYSICFNKEYLTLFVDSIINRSIIEHYSSELIDNKKENVFKKSNKTKLSKKNINIILDYFGEKWK